MVGTSTRGAEGAACAGIQATFRADGLSICLWNDFVRGKSEEGTAGDGGGLELGRVSADCRALISYQRALSFYEMRHDSRQPYCIRAFILVQMEVVGDAGLKGGYTVL